MIVNVEEFAELCGVTPETMRAHLKAVQGQPAWLIERGGPGRPYRIDHEAGLAWWREKREADERASAERERELAQLRLELVGPAAGSDDELALSGKKRSEEYAAVMDRIKLRRIMGELVERAEIEAQLTHAAVEARQRLMRIPGEYAAAMGIALEDVQPLATMIERTVEQFVEALSLPPAGGESA